MQLLPTGLNSTWQNLECSPEITLFHAVELTPAGLSPLRLSLERVPGFTLWFCKIYDMYCRKRACSEIWSRSLLWSKLPATAHDRHLTDTAWATWLVSFVIHLSPLHNLHLSLYINTQQSINSTRCRLTQLKCTCRLSYLYSQNAKLAKDFGGCNDGGHGITEPTAENAWDGLCSADVAKDSRRSRQRKCQWNRTIMYCIGASGTTAGAIWTNSGPGHWGLTTPASCWTLKYSSGKC